MKDSKNFHEQIFRAIRVDQFLANYNHALKLHSDGLGTRLEFFKYFYRYLVNVTWSTLSHPFRINSFRLLVERYELVELQLYRRVITTASKAINK